MGYLVNHVLTYLLTKLFLCFTEFLATLVYVYVGRTSFTRCTKRSPSRNM